MLYSILVVNNISYRMRSYLITSFIYLRFNMKSSDSLRASEITKNRPHFMVLALSPGDFW